MPVVIDDPDILLRIIRAFKDAVRTPEHLVPLAPVFDEVSVRIHDTDDVRPLVIDARLPNIQIIARRLSIRCEKRSRRAGRCCIAPRSEEHTSELQSRYVISYAVF